MIKFIQKYDQQISLSIGLILVAIIAFGAGRLSVHYQDNKEPIVFKNNENLIQANIASMIAENKGVAVQNSDFLQNVQSTELHEKSSEHMFVASKNSNKYHWPDCSWAKKIKPENQVWYKNEKEAQKAGKTRCSYFEDNTPKEYKP